MPAIYILSVAGTATRAKWVVAIETLWSTNLDYLLSGPLRKDLLILV